LKKAEKGVTKMIKPVAIDHVVLRTDRYAELIDFYCQVLGCSLERATSAEFGLTQLRAGNALIDIVDVDGELGKLGGAAPGETGNNVDHFCLQIEPFEEIEIQKYLRSRGVEAGNFEDRYGAQGMGRSLYIKDLAGNTVELRAVI
jgi:glyoxylase I family protein